MFKKEDSVKDYLEQQKEKIDELFALCKDPEQDSVKTDKKSVEAETEKQNHD
jgi:hypothetical protein